jgi:hypothetical protein
MGLRTERVKQIIPHRERGPDIFLCGYFLRGLGTVGVGGTVTWRKAPESEQISEGQKIGTSRLNVELRLVRHPEPVADCPSFSGLWFARTRPHSRAAGRVLPRFTRGNRVYRVRSPRSFRRRIDLHYVFYATP